jgi:hypothetical protein
VGWTDKEQIDYGQTAQTEKGQTKRTLIETAHCDVRLKCGDRIRIPDDTADAVALRPKVCAASRCESRAIASALPRP